MAYDKNQSHSTYNKVCYWWHRKEDDVNEPDEIITQRVASGSFYAKEVAPLRNQDIQIGGVFMFEKDAVTLKTPDNVIGLSSEDLVKWDGELWRVVTTQRSKARIQNTFFAKDKKCSHFWYIELRK